MAFVGEEREEEERLKGMNKGVTTETNQDENIKSVRQCAYATPRFPPCRPVWNHVSPVGRKHVSNREREFTF
jgi:hypothetical protein